MKNIVLMVLTIALGIVLWNMNEGQKTVVRRPSSIEKATLKNPESVSNDMQKNSVAQKAQSDTQVTTAKKISFEEALKYPEFHKWASGQDLSEGQAREKALEKGYDVEATAEGFVTKPVDLSEDERQLLYSQEEWSRIEDQLLLQLNSGEKAELTERDILIIESWKAGNL